MAVETAGIGMPGLKRRTHSLETPSGIDFTHAISMMRSARGFVPVVSVSKNTSGRSSGSRPRSTARIVAGARRSRSVVLGEEPEERLADAGEEPALLPLRLREHVALSDVGAHHRLHDRRERAVVHGDVHLGVLLHRPVYEVDRADRGPYAVDDHHLVV